MGGFGGAVLEALAAAGARAARCAASRCPIGWSSTAIPAAQQRALRPRRRGHRARRARAAPARLSAAAAEARAPAPRRAPGRATGSRRSRSRAEALILAGQVLVDDAPVDKPGTRVRDEARGAPARRAARASSRAAARSSPARSPISASIRRGRRCLDVGASTGGFTDCLLQRGARRVVAVDVGYGQLDAAAARRSARRRARAHATRASSSRGDAARRRSIWSTVDVSFISLRLLLPRARARSRPTAELLRAGEAAVRGRARARWARAAWCATTRCAPQAVARGARGRRRRSGSRRSARPRAGSRGPRETARCSSTCGRDLREPDDSPRGVG